MRALRAWLWRLAGLLSPARRESGLAEEIESHLQLQADDAVRSGATPEQARRDAVLALGGVEAVKEACRDQRGIPVLDHLARDVRFALRQLRRAPGFALTAVTVLALGLAASVAIFAFVEAALLRPLPYPDPQRLVGVYESHPLCPLCDLSYRDYRDWREQNSVFGSLDVYQRSGFILTEASGAAQPVRGARVSAGFFDTLGVRPALGRGFAPGDDLPGAPETLLLSHGAWQRLFAGRPDVLGRSVDLDGTPHTVIGVLPAGFSFAPAEPAELWAALQPVGPCLERRSCHNLNGVGRLREGATLEAARADTKAIAARLERQYPDSNNGQGAAVAPLADVVVGDLRPVLWLLLGGAGLLLLIAALDVAGLLLVRAEGRRRELAVRSALGAARLRLATQFVTEALVLVAAGALLGLALAGSGMRLLLRLIPEAMLAGMPFFRDLGLTPRVLAFACAVSLLAVIVFSIAPALRLPGAAGVEALADGARGGSGGSWRRLGARLVVAELATAMVLLIGAGLLGRSLHALLSVELGFRPDALSIVEVAAPDSGYATPEARLALAREVEARVAGLPGVESVGLTSVLPLGKNGYTRWFRRLDRPHHGEHNDVPDRAVSAGYLEALGARLLAGRGFREDDDLSRPRVAIVNRSLAGQYFPGEDPVGKRIAYVTGSPEPLEIVGIVEDVREGALDAAARAVLYHPLAQDPDTGFAVVFRTGRRERTALPEAVAAIRALDPGLVTQRETTMSRRIADSPAAWLKRSATWLVGGFAATALLLSVVGLYGVIAYTVAQRTREIGIRMALGARRRAVVGQVLGEAGRLSAWGIALGLLGSAATAGLVGRLLFGVRPWDPLTLAGVACLLGLAALLAGCLPARRAASVDPAVALRAE